MSILMSEHKSIDTTARICCYESQLLFFLQILLQHVCVVQV